MAPKVNPNRYGDAPRQAGWDFLGWGESIAAGANRTVFERTAGKANTGERDVDLSWTDKLFGATLADVENLRLNKNQDDLNSSGLGEQGDRYGLSAKKGESRGAYSTRVDAAERTKGLKDKVTELGGVASNFSTDEGLAAEIERLDIAKYERSPAGKRLAASDKNALLRQKENDRRWDLTEQREADRQLNQQAERADVRADNAKDRQMQWMFKQMESRDARERYDKELALYESDKQKAEIGTLVAALASLGGAFAV